MSEADNQKPSNGPMSTRIAQMDPSVLLKRKEGELYYTPESAFPLIHCALERYLEDNAADTRRWETVFPAQTALSYIEKQFLHLWGLASSDVASGPHDIHEDRAAEAWGGTTDEAFEYAQDMTQRVPAHLEAPYAAAWTHIRGELDRLQGRSDTWEEVCNRFNRDYGHLYPECESVNFGWVKENIFNAIDELSKRPARHLTVKEITQCVSHGAVLDGEENAPYAFIKIDDQAYANICAQLTGADADGGEARPTVDTGSGVADDGTGHSSPSAPFLSEEEEDEVATFFEWYGAIPLDEGESATRTVILRVLDRLRHEADDWQVADNPEIDATGEAEAKVRFAIGIVLAIEPEHGKAACAAFEELCRRAQGVPRQALYDTIRSTIEDTRITATPYAMTEYILEAIERHHPGVIAKEDS